MVLPGWAGWAILGIAVISPGIGLLIGRAIGRNRISKYTWIWALMGVATGTAVTMAALVILAICSTC